MLGLVTYDYTTLYAQHWLACLANVCAVLCMHNDNDVRGTQTKIVYIIGSHSFPQSGYVRLVVPHVETEAGAVPGGEFPTES